MCFHVDRLDKSLSSSLSPSFCPLAEKVMDLTNVLSFIFTTTTALIVSNLFLMIKISERKLYTPLHVECRNGRNWFGITLFEHRFRIVEGCKSPWRKIYTKIKYYRRKKSNILCGQFIPTIFWLRQIHFYFMSISVVHFVDLLSLCPFTITTDNKLKLFPYTHLEIVWQIQSLWIKWMKSFIAIGYGNLFKLNGICNNQSIVDRCKLFEEK